MAAKRKTTPEPEWEVERVVAKRKASRQFEYRVKWVGFPEAENTWEPVANLANSKQLILDYEAAVGADTGRDLAKGTTNADDASVSCRAVSKCGVCGLPKKGHTCTGKQAGSGANVDADATRGAKGKAPARVAVKPEARGRRAPGSPQPSRKRASRETPSEDDEGGAAEAEEEEEYEVEAVLAQRARCGSMEYQVKWKGYTYMESTWLPAANLSGCPELIVEFESGMAATAGVLPPVPAKTASKVPRGRIVHESDDEPDAEPRAPPEPATAIAQRQPTGSAGPAAPGAAAEGACASAAAGGAAAGDEAAGEGGDAADYDFTIGNDEEADGAIAAGSVAGSAATQAVGSAAAADVAAAAAPVREVNLGKATVAQGAGKVPVLAPAGRQCWRRRR